MDFINNIMSSLKAEKGQLTLNLDKKSMIASKVKREKDNHIEIRNKYIRIIISQLENNAFNLSFATIFVSTVDKKIEFENEKEIDLYFEWSDVHYKIVKNGSVISENNALPKKTPGGTIQLDIRPMLNEKQEFQYILDIGEKESLTKERLSLFIDKQFTLNFRILDKNGKEFIAKKIKSIHWKPDTWFQILCSWNEEYIKIRTINASDEQDYDEIKIDIKSIKLFYMPINPPMILGTDLTKKYFSKMYASELRLYDIPII